MRKKMEGQKKTYVRKKTFWCLGLIGMCALFSLLSGCGSKEDETDRKTKTESTRSERADEAKPQPEAKEIAPVVPEPSPPSAIEPGPSKNALLVATLRPEPLTERGIEAISLLDFLDLVLEMETPESLLKFYARLGKKNIDSKKPVHVFIERGKEDENSSEGLLYCIVAKVKEVDSLRTQLRFESQFGNARHSTVGDLTFGHFDKSNLSFGFNDEHLAIALDLDNSVTHARAERHVRALFQKSPSFHANLEKHLARPFHLGIYLRPNGARFAPDFMTQGSLGKLTLSTSTTTLQFDPEKLVVRFKRFSAKENESPASVNQSPVPPNPLDVAASVAVGLKGNASDALGHYVVEKLFKFILPIPMDTSYHRQTEVKEGQWLAIWNGAKTANGSFQGVVGLQGNEPDGNATTPLDLSGGRAEQIRDARFSIKVDARKSLALLRSIPNPEGWRQDLVKLGEKLDGLSWSGDLLDSTLTLTFRNRESNPVGTWLEMTRESEATQEGIPLYEAIAAGDFKALEKAMENVDLELLTLRHLESPLHFAARNGQRKMVGYFIRKGLDVDSRDRSGRTTLHRACWSGMKKTVQTLLEHNATVDARNEDNATAAMVAARMGHLELVQMLLQAGANLNLVDQGGNGLLEYAAGAGRKEITVHLQDRNATVRRPLHVAAGLGNLAKVQTLLEGEREIDEQDGWGATALLFAAGAGKPEVMSFLLKKGANPEISDSMGFTLVHAAAISGHEKVLQQVLALNLDLNPRHKHAGATPLDWALSKDDKILSKLLQENGAKTSWELGAP
tara:strand:+ start:4651 stop:7023 length:2373 start_codon:yes stop_codon:yes gene_type:complete